MDIRWSAYTLSIHHMDTKKPEFPMRINKYLAVKQYCTRREADEIIKKGKVFINGKLARLGDKVS